MLQSKFQTRNWYPYYKLNGIQKEKSKIHHCTNGLARHGGAEVAGWTLDRKIRVRFPACPHRMWALWWQGGKRGRLGTLKTPSCSWRGCPAAGQNLETGHLSRHYIAEISLNVTLNHKQHQHHKRVELKICIICTFRVLNPCQCSLAKHFEI